MTACGSVKNGFMWKHDRTKAFGESRMEKKDLKSMTLEELTEFVKELGEKPGKTVIPVDACKISRVFRRMYEPSEVA